MFGLSPTLIGTALLVVVTLFGGLIQRQCTVMDLDEKIDDLEMQADEDKQEIKRLGIEVNDVRQVNFDLKEANTELAKAAQQQSQLNAAFADAMAQQDLAANADKAKSAEALARERATTLWLSDLIKRGGTTPPGACEAAIGVGLVRKALRGEEPLAEPQ